jgi:hypothetical protein
VSELLESLLPVDVYRRIHPSQWNSRKNRPGRAAFLEAEGEGRSLFRADLQSARGVMEHAINAARERAASADESEKQRGEKQLAQFGETVDDWLRAGWRVVRIPLSEFIDRGYTIDEPDASGHVNTVGDHAIHASEVAEIAREVQAEEFGTE